MRHSRNSFARFIPIILVIVITIVAVAAVIAIGRALLSGGDKKQDTVVVDEGRTSLLATDLSRSVRLTVRGPIVANEKHRSYQITVSAGSRVMTTYEGYLEKQLESKTFDNNAQAYEEFVHALDKRKMMSGKALKDDQNDLRGICATGKVYTFETLITGDPVKTLWTSDCKGSPGSAAGDTVGVIDMFLKQIPDGAKMATGVGLHQETSFFSL